MKRSDEYAVKSVIKFLQLHGFEAHRMPELKKKTCDVVARYGKQHYYIEVKQRLRPIDPSYDVTVGYRSSVHKIIETAVKQLQSMPDVKGLFRVIWFVVSEKDDRLLTKGIVNTLYGIQRIRVGRGDLELETDCMFYNHSPFLKWPDLCLVVIQTEPGLIFCLNLNFAQAGKIKRSRIFKLPKRLDGVLDPVVAEKHGCCLIAESGHSECEKAKKTLKKYAYEWLSLVNERLFSRSRRIRLNRGASKSKCLSGGKARSA